MATLAEGDRKKLPAKDFAEPGKRAYPIKYKTHATNAKARSRARPSKAGRMSKSEETKLIEKRMP